MHFIILIPIILLFKLILWVLGFAIVGSIFKAIGEFVWNYKKPIAILSVLMCSYFYYINSKNVESKNTNYSYVEPPPPLKPDYFQKLQNHKNNHKKLLVCDSAKVTQKFGEDVQFEISLRNKDIKTIKEFHGYLMIWDKNNKYIGEYSFTESDLQDESFGPYWDDKRKEYFYSKESDDWILPNRTKTFGFGYSDETIKTYNFKKFKYLVCFSRVVFTDSSEYREQW